MIKATEDLEQRHAYLRLGGIDQCGDDPWSSFMADQPSPQAWLFRHFDADRRNYSRLFIAPETLELSEVPLPGDHHSSRVAADGTTTKHSTGAETKLRRKD